MSVIGPRPQLVRDMVFMTDEQRMRHTAKPGLSGLAQVNGRNAISWEDKIDWDLKYIERVMKEKGIEDAVNAVNKINKLENRRVFILDIYGQIDKNQPMILHLLRYRQHM